MAFLNYDVKFFYGQSDSSICNSIPLNQKEFDKWVTLGIIHTLKPKIYLIFMGKGDRKTRKGKITKGTFGVRRPKQKHKLKPEPAQKKTKASKKKAST